MSVSNRSNMLGMISRSHSEKPSTPHVIISDLMQAFESDDYQMLLNQIHQMSIDLDGMSEAKEILDRIIHNSNKLINMLPEEVR